MLLSVDVTNSQCIILEQASNSSEVEIETKKEKESIIQCSQRGQKKKKKKEEETLSKPWQKVLLADLL